MDLLIARDWKSLFKIQDVQVAGTGLDHRPLLD